MGLVFCGFIFTLTIIWIVCAEYYILRTYYKCSEQVLHRRITGCEMARRVLDKSGLNSVSVELAKDGSRTFFRIREGVLRLPQEVYSKSSVMALGVAAYEAAWASQITRTPALIVLMSVARFWSSLMVPLAFIFFLTAAIFPGQLAFIYSAALILIVYLSIFGIILPMRFKVARELLLGIGGSESFNGRESELLRSVMAARALSHAGGLIDWLDRLFLSLRSVFKTRR